MTKKYKNKYRKKKVKTKSNKKLSKDVQIMKKTLTMLKKVNEPLDIWRLDNDAVYMNAEDSVQVYRVTQDPQFTSKSVADAPGDTPIPQDAYRKGSELYINKIDFYLQLINRQSTYSTRLMVIQFKDNHDISRSLGSGGNYTPDSLMSSNFARWNIVGSIPEPLIVGNPPAGAYPHFAGLMMKQPVKDVKNRYNAFHVLHDEVFTNPEIDQIPGQQIENQSTCFKRSVFPKIKRLNFDQYFHDSPLCDIIAIVFNNQPKHGKWQNPNSQVVSTRGHCLNWTYKVYDN